MYRHLLRAACRQKYSDGLGLTARASRRGCCSSSMKLGGGRGGASRAGGGRRGVAVAVAIAQRLPAHYCSHMLANSTCNLVWCSMVSSSLSANNQPILPCTCYFNLPSLRRHGVSIVHATSRASSPSNEEAFSHMIELSRDTVPPTLASSMLQDS